MDSIRVAWPWREQIDNHQMNVAGEELNCFLNKRSQGALAGLIAVGNQLDNGNHAVAGDVANDDALLLLSIEFLIGFSNQANLRFFEQHTTAILVND